MAGRALVLGDDSRACLSVVRSLGRKHINVTLGVQEPDSLVQHSRFTSSVIRFPSSTSSPKAWAQRLAEVLAEQKYDLVIPTSDNTLVPIAQQRADFERLAKFAIPDDAGFVFSYQKQHTFCLASELGVPAPRTRLVESQDDLDLICAEESLAFPMVVKPSSSKVWKDGRKLSLSVHLAADLSELKQHCLPLIGVTPVLVQDYFHGVGVGQEFLARDGTIVRGFQHERVHEPMGGGGSSYRKSVALHAQMLECSAKMLARMRWTGVVMVEYKLQPDTGQFALMEINGRFWGSLPLAIAAGADFPWELYNLLVDGKTPVPSTPRTGVYCRNLIKDLDWFRKNWSADRGNPFLMSRSRSDALRDMARLLRPAEHLDTMTLDDPFPGVVEAARLFTSIAHRVGDRVKIKALTVRADRPAWRREQRASLHRALEVRKQFLFICKGNICRSPFAAEYARRRMADLGMVEFTATSSGTYMHGDRPSPDTAQTVGREFGVELSGHRSSVLNEDEIDRAGAILCMDYKNYKDLLETFPAAGPRLFYLLPFDDDARGFQIRDPWNQPAETFRACYRQIASSVDALLQAVQ